jgi:hypothetical protein
MRDPDEAARAEILARLADSRRELRRVLDPPRQNSDGSSLGGADAGHRSGGFPRSRTMQLLLSGRGLGTLGAVVGGLLIARPALALRLLKMLPASAFARMLIVKGITSLRAGKGEGQQSSKRVNPE